MRKIFGVIGLIAVLALLALGPGTSTRAGVYTRMVSEDGLGCAPGGETQYTNILNAVNEANPGDTIFVCAGTYQETARLELDVPNVTLEGASKALVTVKLADNANYDTVIFVTETGVHVLNMTIDGTLPSGCTGCPTSNGIVTHSSDVEVAGNKFIGAIGQDVFTAGSSVPTGIHISSNEFIVIGYGIYGACSQCTIDNNTFEPAGSTPAIGISIHGDDNDFTQNSATRSSFLALGNSSLFTGNSFTGEGSDDESFFQLEFMGEGVEVVENTFGESGPDHGGGVQVFAGFSNTSATFAGNHFGSGVIGIFLNDANPNDAFQITASISGGTPADANVFTDPDNTQVFVQLSQVTSDIDAENNEWGLCSAEEIEEKIYHSVDNPDVGTVDFEPFIKPAGCPSATPSPSPSPLSSPTPITTASPSPSPSPTASPVGQRTWGDIDCDGILAAIDALKLMLGSLSLSYDKPQSCPSVGQEVVIAADQRWGDINCSGAPNAIDALNVLATLAGTPITPDTSCPSVGDPITVTVR